MIDESRSTFPAFVSARSAASFGGDIQVSLMRLKAEVGTNCPHSSSY